MEKMYKTSEAMEILNVSYTTLFRMIVTGEIKSVKVGGQHRIPESELKRIQEHGTEQ